VREWSLRGKDSFSSSSISCVGGREGYDLSGPWTTKKKVMNVRFFNFDFSAVSTSGWWLLGKKKIEVLKFWRAHNSLIGYECSIFRKPWRQKNSSLSTRKIEVDKPKKLKLKNWSFITRLTTATHLRHVTHI
jgi:hypothetical protein